MIGVQNQIERTSFENLNGWTTAHLEVSLAAFRRSAEEILTTAHGFKRTSEYSGQREDWIAVCEGASKAKDAHSFFKTNFIPFKIHDDKRPDGLFTGYYEPLAKGSRTRTERYTVPIYRRPPELVSFPAEIEAANGFRYGQLVEGSPNPFHNRRQIETGALDGRGLEICWLDSWTDAFFIHVQGQGRIALDDGTTLRLAFAAKNGQPYSSIGSALLAKGHGTPATMSMQFLREWIEANPKAGRELMWQNNSYIFFRDISVPDPSLGGLGAAQVNLTPHHSLAIDRHYWMFGTPFWLETATPPEAAGGAAPFSNLMIGQDTGTAIRGLLRGDVYWGWGEIAITNAGHMKSPGRMTALLPHAVARRLGL
jgi:membrane-bound lytic murein transglycosylase A